MYCAWLFDMSEVRPSIIDRYYCILTEDILYSSTYISLAPVCGGLEGSKIYGCMYVCMYSVLFCRWLAFKLEVIGYVHGPLYTSQVRS